ncbi:MAG: hypothetical protein RL095_1810 [Verrucomicrobiota bacterium]|jgi:hypothetical protein
MNTTLIALAIGGLGVTFGLLGKKRPLLKFLAIPLCLCGVTLALLQINSHPEAERINRLEAAYFHAQAEILADELALAKAKKCLIVHPPSSDGKSGFEGDLLNAFKSRGLSVSLTIPSSWKKPKTETFEPYFEGASLPPILKLKEFDAIIFTAGLPPPPELAEVPRFAPDADPALFKPKLYVFNGDDPGLLPFVHSGALTGMVSWRPKPSAIKDPIDSLSSRQIFDSRYLLVLHGKLKDLAASEKDFYPKILGGLQD